MLDVAIVGTGLSGLSLADSLMGCKRGIAVFEARKRCGGRILTHTLTAEPKPSVFADLGPAWLWPGHQPRMAALVKRLGLELFRQWDSGHSLYQMNADAAPVSFIDTETHATARRIKGGCRQLIDGLLRGLPDSRLHLSHRLLRVSDHRNYVDLEFETESGPSHYQAKQVVLAVPPRFGKAIAIVRKPWPCAADHASGLWTPLAVYGSLAGQALFLRDGNRADGRRLSRRGAGSRQPRV